MLRILLAVALLSAAALAQPPRSFFPWWDQPMAQDLNLTPIQKRQIRLAVREYRDKLIEARAAFEKAELQLQDVFEDETLDRARADAAVENLAHARENLTRTFAQMAIKMRTVLTQQQWKELQRRRAAREAEKKALEKKP